MGFARFGVTPGVRLPCGTPANALVGVVHHSGRQARAVWCSCEKLSVCAQHQRFLPDGGCSGSRVAALRQCRLSVERALAAPQLPITLLVAFLARAGAGAEAPTTGLRSLLVWLLVTWSLACGLRVVAEGEHLQSVRCFLIPV